MAKAAPRPWTPTEERWATVFIKIMSAANTWAYRATGGWLGGKFRGGAPVCLVTVKGRKSGNLHTLPLLYLADGDDIILVASKGGMSKHPVWYLNLEANPRCEVEIGRERRTMVSRRVSPEEKKALWPRLCAMYPDYDDYQARTTRDIPVLRLSPA
ncbi:MAG TPA: nitroreductase family deazaflavin-dependent oxidoreductase [Candidatus Eisenbacteria bacterium]|nr:nitroreductase family deazaflavin-dependent oxidoreductase [Candidatus Eisenbacteria bacterium]